MAHDSDGLVFLELVEGAGRDLVHGDVGAVGNVRGGVLPGLADIEEKRWVLGGEQLFELVDGDFKVHRLRIMGLAPDEAVECCQRLAMR